jgi:hypothetical protein
MKNVRKEQNVILIVSALLKNIFISMRVHGGFLERVYEIELDTKTEYEGFLGTLSTFQNGYF